jgi:hypothetical protein
MLSEQNVRFAKHQLSRLANRYPDRRSILYNRVPIDALDREDLMTVVAYLYDKLDGDDRIGLDVDRPCSPRAAGVKVEVVESLGDKAIDWWNVRNPFGPYPSIERIGNEHMPEFADEPIVLDARECDR